MFIKRKRFIWLILSAIWLLSGCNGEQVSLEEALFAGIEVEALPGISSEGIIGVFSGDMPERDGTEDATGWTGSEYIQADLEGENLVYVYVCGAVQKPGVYTLPGNSRIVAAIEAAGGFLPEAAMEAVNLAEPVRDGIQITVPDIMEYEKGLQEEGFRKNGMVNVNTATTEELCSLNGIGETRAQAILAYREEIGGFRSVEQLKEVSGIGDSLFNQIKNHIYIE